MSPFADSRLLFEKKYWKSREEYFKIARENLEYNFLQAPFFDKIDYIFSKLIENSSNPKSIDGNHHLLMAHSAYRATGLLLAAGAAANSYPVTRQMLEYAQYGYLIYVDPEFHKHWRKREESKASLNFVRNNIGNRFRDKLKSRNTNLYQAFREWYQILIDGGAHPTYMGMHLSMDVEERNDSLLISHLYLDKKGSVLARLCALNHTAIISLRLFRLVMRERFEILQISELIDDIGAQNFQFWRDEVMPLFTK